MALLSLCLALTLLADEPMAPTARTRYPYWQMVDEVVLQIESQTPRPMSINSGLRTPGQEYPFESFRHLRPTDLIRAAKEGVQVARQEAALGISAAELDQKVLRNVTIALEYLPLLIRDEKDAEELIHIMRNRAEDPVLRRYLIERSVEGYVKPNLLSAGLPVFFRSLENRFIDGLTNVAAHPMEGPELQETAIRALFTYFMNDYEAVLNNDPAVKTLLESGGAVSFAMVLGENAPELSRDTLTQLNRTGMRMNMFAEAIAGHIAEESVRNEQVKKCTRETIEFIKDSIMGVNKERLAIYLEGRTPEPDAAFPAFPLLADPIPEQPTQDGLTMIPLPEDGGPINLEDFGL